MLYNSYQASKKRQKLGFPHNFIADWRYYSSSYFDEDGFSQEEARKILEYMNQVSLPYGDYLKKYYCDCMTIGEIIKAFGLRDSSIVIKGLESGSYEIIKKIHDNRNFFPSLKSKYGTVLRYDYSCGFPPVKSVWEVTDLSMNDTRSVVPVGENLTQEYLTVKELGSCVDFIVWLKDEDEEKANSIYVEYMLSRRLEIQKEINALRQEYDLLEKHINDLPEN